MILACALLTIFNLIMWQLVAFEYFEGNGKENILVQLHRAYNKRYLAYHYERVHTYEMR